MSEKTTAASLDIWQSTKDILGVIDQEREREIISRRFGLYDRRETLEQIGELLGITRERVRQLEKAILARLKAMADEDLPHIKDIESVFTNTLEEMGRAATISDLAKKLTDEASARDKAHVAFLANLTPSLAVVDENDFFYHSVGIARYHDTKAMKTAVETIVKAVKEAGEPVSLSQLQEKLSSFDNEAHIGALASTSKKLATLGGKWGLIKWPTVNPKNIRDKIYVILQDNKEPMHFNAIAQAIKDSGFKRRNVTTQAIHNELIKDSRFVLIGRGIYALKEWGYKKGTVADTITDVLKKEGGPLHRDEIVKRVLKSRKVKETTILLNLQGKQQFKRVAKATYDLAETEA